MPKALHFCIVRAMHIHVEVCAFCKSENYDQRRTLYMHRELPTRRESFWTQVSQHPYYVPLALH